MKKITLILVLTFALGACATNDSASSKADTDGAPKTKKVCSYEKSSGTGSRMERVCRYVDVT